jgi:Fe2+ transport system protein FeoA
MSLTPLFIQSPVHTREVPLSKLRTGERGRIARIDEPALEIALLKMGITVGDQITYSGAAPLGGPIAVRAAHTKFSLRREDATHLWINRG